MNVNIIKNNIRERFKSMKTREKLFLALFSLALILILLLGSTFQSVYVQMLIKNTRSFTGEYLEELSNNLENKTGNLNDETYKLIADADFTGLIADPTKLESRDGLRKFRQDIRKTGNLYFTNSSPVSAFFAADANGNTAWWVKYKKSFYYGSVNEELAAGILAEAQEELKTVNRNTCWFIRKEDGGAYLARNMVDMINNLGQVYGTVVFAIEPSFFQTIQSGNSMITNDNLIFINNDSRMLYNASEYLDDFQPYLAVSEQRYGTSLTEISIGNEKFMFAEYIKNSTEWSLYALIPEMRFMGTVGMVKWYMIGFCVAAAGISLLLSSILSKNMSRNISDLEKNMRRVEQGDFRVHIEPSGNDEIGMLCNRFNYMADKIEELIGDAYREGQAKQKLQYQVLKAQINPHFLYNSLGSIKCMAKMEKKENIEQMTTALIELLRVSLSRTSEYLTVKEETDYIRNYFILQQFRYENGFRVLYQISPDTAQCIMLNFILQPLVENALFHGIKISKRNGVIQITSSITDGKLKLTVEDNGIGMTGEKIAEILSAQEARYEGLNSIGVANVSQRIKQYFGEAYGLNYISTPGEGSIAEVWLPLLKSMEEVAEYVQHYDCGR